MDPIQSTLIVGGFGNSIKLDLILNIVSIFKVDFWEKLREMENKACGEILCGIQQYYQAFEWFPRTIFRAQIFPINSVCVFLMNLRIKKSFDFPNFYAIHKDQWKSRSLIIHSD